MCILENKDIIGEYKEGKKLFIIMGIIESLKGISALGFWGSTARLILWKLSLLLHPSPAFVNVSNY